MPTKKIVAKKSLKKIKKSLPIVEGGAEISAMILGGYVYLKLPYNTSLFSKQGTFLLYEIEGISIWLERR